MLGASMQASHVASGSPDSALLPRLLRHQKYCSKIVARKIGLQYLTVPHSIHRKPLKSCRAVTSGVSGGGWTCFTTVDGRSNRDTSRHCPRLRRCQHIAAAAADSSDGSLDSKQSDGFGAADEATPPSSFQADHDNGSGDAEQQDSTEGGYQVGSNGEAVYNSVEAQQQRNMAENADEQEILTRDFSDVSEEEAMYMEEQVSEYVKLCHQRYNIDDLVEIGLAAPNMPAVLLRHPNGSEALVYLHGANVSSWTRPNGHELLYLRPGNPFDGVSPIRGGIPIAFPQVGRGALPTNGFLSSVHWSIADTGVSDEEVATDRAPSVALFTESDESTTQMWPHHFEAMYTISLMESDDFPETTMPEADSAPQNAGGAPGSVRPGAAGGKQRLRFDNEEKDPNPVQLRCVLEILNTDDKEMTFTTALQTHFAIKPLGEYPGHSRSVRVLGLGGKYTLDYAKNPSNPQLITDPEDYIYFGDRVVDRVYVDTEETDMMLCPGDRTHHQLFNRQGFSDCAITNPFSKAREEYKDFVTMQSARVARPVKLQPGESFVGEMVIRSYNTMWERPMFEYEQGEPLAAEPMPDTAGVDRRPASRLEGVEAERIDMEE